MAVIKGTPGDDVLVAENPNDIFIGSAGNDVIDGGEDMKYIKGVGVWISKKVKWILTYSVAPIIVGVVIFIIINFLK